MNFLSEGNIRTIDIFDVPLKMSKKPGLIKQLSEAKHLAKKLRESKVNLGCKIQRRFSFKIRRKSKSKISKNCHSK